MGYLDAYGNKKRKFQEGGAMAPAPAPVQAGPEAPGAGGQEEQILALAQATVQGDQQAAAELGAILAPMILQELEAAGGAGGAEAGGQAPAPQGAEPVFRRGGQFVGTLR